jgi:hypothetical protein
MSRRKKPRDPTVLTVKERKLLAVERLAWKGAGQMTFEETDKQTSNPIIREGEEQ